MLDAPRDTATPPDAPPSGGWLRIAGTWPDWCRIEQADPELVATTHFSITPCADRAGCRELVPDWRVAEGDYAVRLWARRGNGSHDGERGHVIFNRDAGTADSELWVVDDTGQAELGFRSDRALLTTCNPGAADVDGGRFATEVGYADGDRSASAHLVELNLADPHALRFAGDVAAETAALDDIQDLYVSEAAVAAHLISFHLMRITEARGIEDVYASASALGTLRAVVGETLLFTTYNGSMNDVRVSAPDTANEVVSAPGRPADEIDGDGEHLVWLEWDSTDRRVGRIDLDVMASPYAETRATLSPRSLEHFAVAFDRPLDLGHGYASFQIDVDRMHLYRLSDGAIAEVVSPASEAWSDQPAYLGPDEVALLTEPLVGRRETRRVMFIRYDSLDWRLP